MVKEIKFEIEGNFISFSRNPSDTGDEAGDDEVVIGIAAGPTNDEQMETYLYFTKDEAIEILEAALKLVKGA